MAEKEKPKPLQTKHIPKDGQVILAIMKEMGITEYEPKTIVQLTEFVYRYATSILEEARMYANNSTLKKKSLDADDVRLALELTSESTFTSPPPREVILECARVKNYSQLPPVKPHCGLRLPPDRYCLSACNYTLKSPAKKGTKTTFSMSGGMGLKINTKPNMTFIKRTNPVGVVKQTVAIPKPIAKVAQNPVQGHGQQTIQQNTIQKTVLKPKIQITQNIQIAEGNNTPGSITPMEVDNNSLKRKREDDNEGLS